MAKDPSKMTDAELDAEINLLKKRRPKDPPPSEGFPPKRIPKARDRYKPDPELLAEQEARALLKKKLYPRRAPVKGYVDPRVALAEDLRKQFIDPTYAPKTYKDPPLTAEEKEAQQVVQQAEIKRLRENAPAIGAYGLGGVASLALAGSPLLLAAPAVGLTGLAGGAAGTFYGQDRAPTGPEALEFFLANALGEGAGRGLHAFLKRRLAPVEQAKRLHASAKDAIKFIREIGEGTGKKGLRPLPAELSDLPGLDIAQNIIRASFFGGKLVSQKEADIAKAFQMFARALIERLGPTMTPERFGQLFTEFATAGTARGGGAIPLSKRFFQDFITELYGEVDRLAARAVRNVPAGVDPSKSPIIPTVGMKSAIIGAVERAAPGASDALSVEGLIGTEVHQAIKLIDGQADHITFKLSETIRSTLSEIANTKNLAPRDKAAVTEFIVAIGEAQDAAIKELGAPQVKLALRKARKISSQRFRFFKDEFIIALAESKPTEVAARLLGVNKVEDVRALLLVLARGRERAKGGGSWADVSQLEKLWPEIQAATIQNFLQDATTNGVIQGRFLKEMLDPRTKGNKFAIFRLLLQRKGRHALPSLKRFADALALVQDKAGAGEGKIFIQLAQAGALVHAAQSVVEGEMPPTSAFAILLGPYVLGRLLLNPVGAKILSEGVKLPRGSKAAINALTRLVTVMNREGLTGQLIDTSSFTAGVFNQDAANLLQRMKRPTDVFATAKKAAEDARTRGKKPVRPINIPNIRPPGWPSAPVSPPAARPLR